MTVFYDGIFHRIFVVQNRSLDCGQDYQIAQTLKSENLLRLLCALTNLLRACSDANNLQFECKIVASLVRVVSKMGK